MNIARKKYGDMQRCPEDMHKDISHRVRQNLEPISSSFPEVKYHLPPKQHRQRSFTEKEELIRAMGEFDSRQLAQMSVPRGKPPRIMQCASAPTKRRKYIQPAYGGYTRYSSDFPASEEVLQQDRVDFQELDSVPHQRLMRESIDEILRRRSSLQWPLQMLQDEEFACTERYPGMCCRLRNF